MQTTINFRITEEQKEHLQLIAGHYDLKISSLIRSIITDYLEEYDDFEIEDDDGYTIELYPPDIKAKKYTNDDLDNFIIT